MSRYDVGLVGEANYQEAIRACREREPVQILHEIGNPYDEEALVVVTQSGEKIGYIARSNWLQRAVHQEGKGCDAQIKAVHRGERGLHGVVIEVELLYDGGGVDCCDYRP